MSKEVAQVRGKVVRDVYPQTPVLLHGAKRFATLHTPSCLALQKSRTSEGHWTGSDRKGPDS